VVERRGPTCEAWPSPTPGKWKAGDVFAWEMAKCAGSDAGVDALATYRARFRAAGMSNASDGVDTLRHVFVLLIGLGMMESAGRYNFWRAALGASENPKPPPRRAPTDVGARDTERSAGLKIRMSPPCADYNDERAVPPGCDPTGADEVAESRIGPLTAACRSRRISSGHAWQVRLSSRHLKPDRPRSQRR
jgi:hypothetical protein